MTEVVDPASIRLVVIDDHELVLQGVVRLLSDEPDMTVVASASSVGDGVEAVREHVPDIVVVDYLLPDGDGASATRVIRAAWPSVQVIMLTGSGDELASFEAERAGCVGFVEKTKAAAELVATIRGVVTGAIDPLDQRSDRLPQVEELALHYQPIVDLQAGTVVGYEALVRWNHPARGLVYPLDFIGLAERSSLIHDLGEFVRREACSTLARWTATRVVGGRDRFVSVNLSGRELLAPNLPALVADALSDAGLDPARLVIEVTESFFIGDLEENTRRLHELKDLGVRIALDDFGTGFSSLDYLRRFPIDIIKLDKRFVDELPDGERGRRLVDSVGHLAEALDAVALAEGIESESQATSLIDLGWQLGQGYYFGHPADQDTTEEQYEARLR